MFSGHFRTGSEVSTCPSEDSSVAPSLETEKLLKKLAEMSEILEAPETKLGTVHILRKHICGLFVPPPPLCVQMDCTRTFQASAKCSR